MNFSSVALSVVFAMTSLTALAADYPAQRQGDWIARDFKFHTGQTMPELRLHYTTIGEPSGLPVLVLHGSGGSAASMLTPAFAGELFGPGQPLDAAKYYIIIPDSLGHGKSAKPSDGLKTAFRNCPGSGFSLRQTKGTGQFGGVLGQGFDDGPALLLGG